MANPTCDREYCTGHALVAMPLEGTAERINLCPDCFASFCAGTITLRKSH